MEQWRPSRGSLWTRREAPGTTPGDSDAEGFEGPERGDVVETGQGGMGGDCSRLRARGSRVCSKATG